MKNYMDMSGKSGVRGYDYGDDWIDVFFSARWVYTYRASGVGALNLETMKKFADAGSGLGSFINATPVVRNGFASRARW